MRWKWRRVGFLLLVVSYPIASEIIYHHDISPQGLSEFSEFADKFSEGARIRFIESESGKWIQATGREPRAGLLAAPSAAPKYYFDAKGKYIGWVGDPGDQETPKNWRAVGKVELLSFEEALALVAENKLLDE